MTLPKLEVQIQSVSDASTVYLRIGTRYGDGERVAIDFTREEAISLYLSLGEYLLKHSEAKES